MKYRVVFLFLKVQIIFLLFLSSNFLLIDNTSNKIVSYQKQNKIQQASDLQLRLAFNESSSGQPDIIDSSTNNFDVSETWLAGSGMNATSYNVNASNSVKIIDSTRFEIAHSDLIGPDGEVPYNFSITVWIYIESFQNNTVNYAFRKNFAYNLGIFNDSQSSNQLKFRFEVNRFEGLFWVYSDTNLSLNQWYFLAMGHNGTDIVLYLDGAFDANASMPFAGSSQGDPLFVGGHVSWTGEKTIYMDDLWYFSEPLNESYIAWLYENSPALDQSEIIIIPPPVPPIPINTAVDAGIDVRLSPITTIFALIFVAVLPILVLLWVINKFLAALGFERSTFAEIFTVLFKRDEDF